MMSYPLDADYLRRHCRNPWSDIVVFDSIDSTSNWVKAQARNKLVCLAERQTAGRGRHGHQWQSPVAENIYLSYSWQFDQTPSHLGLLSLWVGMTLSDVLEKQGLQQHGIKWPNDIYWQHKKMGGILIEVSNLSSQLVVGVGLNVNMQNETGIDQPWTSVFEVVQHTVNRNELLVPLLDALHVAMIKFPYIDHSEFMRHWKRWDLIFGHQVSFVEDGRTLVGEARGVNDSGHLNVMLDSGELRAFGTSISRVRWV
ncbi:MAG: biotin--[acetyl-CoA-carboxylase] ligase [Proteobacteria bacterium]|nr:MAG: biotin--[acetyl-CoA-carboxylase] ligase [Pseudomonadota bacterium]